MFVLIGILVFAGVGCGKKNVVDTQKVKDQKDNKVPPIINEITKGKSIMDIAREKDGTVATKQKYLADCQKSDKDMQDYCFSLGAIYYRDADFCKYLNNLETKKKCNQEIIEKWYADLEKGASSTLPTVPGALITGGGSPDAGCETTDSASLCKQAMKNSMLLGCAQPMSPEDKDNCYLVVALQLRDASLCDKVSDPEKKVGCKKSIETLKDSQPVMPGVIQGNYY